MMVQGIKEIRQYRSTMGFVLVEVDLVAVPREVGHAMRPIASRGPGTHCIQTGHLRLAYTAWGSRCFQNAVTKGAFRSTDAQLTVY